MKLKTCLKANEEHIPCRADRRPRQSPFREGRHQVEYRLRRDQHCLKHLNGWSKPPGAHPRDASFHVEGVPQPLGVVLVLSPWNYPVQAGALPLVGMSRPATAWPSRSPRCDQNTELLLDVLATNVFHARVRLRLPRLRRDERLAAGGMR